MWSVRHDRRCVARLLATRHNCNPRSFRARVTPAARVHSAGVVFDSRIERSAIYVTRATIVTPFGAARG